MIFNINITLAYNQPGTKSDSVISEMESRHTNTASGSAKRQSAPVEGESFNMQTRTIIVQEPLSKFSSFPSMSAIYMFRLIACFVLHV